MWAVWLNVGSKVEKEKKEMVCSGMRVDEMVVVGEEEKYKEK